MSQQNSQKEYSTPAARVKTTNPEYKEYTARLNQVESKDSDTKGMQDFKGGSQAFLGNYCLLSIWVLMVQLLAQD